MALFHSFANLFTVWLKRSQLDSHSHFCNQSVVISYIMYPLENSTVHLQKNESTKGK